MMCLRVLAAPLILLASGLQAQLTTAANAGIIRVKRADLPEATMFSLGAETGGQWARLSFVASLGGERGPSGLGVARAASSATLVSESFARSAVTFRLEGTSSGGSRQATATSFGLTVTNLHDWRSHGASYGAKLGTRLTGGQLMPIGTAAVDWWFRRAGSAFGVRSSLTLTTPDRMPPYAFGNITFAESEASWEHTIAATTLLLSAGGRLGLENVERYGTWAEGSVAWQLDEGVKLVAGAGRRPADIARGIPGERYASLLLQTQLGSVPPTPSRHSGREAIASQRR